VTAYLEAENAYAEAVMAPLTGLRDELYQEMLSHVKQTDVSVPYQNGNWWYYTRTEEGRQYPIHCRTHGSPNATEDTPNRSFWTAICWRGPGLLFDRRHRYYRRRPLAGLLDRYHGFRQYTLHIKDLVSGETLASQIERVGSVVWAADNRTLFYTVEDEEQKRQYQLWRHCVGRPLKTYWSIRTTTSASTWARDAPATANSW